MSPIFIVGLPNSGWQTFCNCTWWSARNWTTHAMCSMAFVPSDGIELWAARPLTVMRHRRQPLLATAIFILVGSETTAASARKPSRSLRTPR